MMTDIHTHILPGVDDGAKNGEEALAMLRLQRESGVERMYLTPHFYPRHQEFEEFLEKRAAARETLRALTVGKDIPEMRLGAEVHYSPDILEMDLRQLTLGDSDFLLLEMPHMIYPAYGEQVVSRILEDGITPILAHVERFPYFRKDPALLKRLIDLRLDCQNFKSVGGISEEPKVLDLDTQLYQEVVYSHGKLEGNRNKVWKRLRV